jgi:3-oxoacyl-[acyl-carrier protein] reductase
MPQQLNDRIALVTGGASGTGLAIARLFAEEGARVLVNDIAPSNWEGAAQTFQADVAVSDQVDAMFEEITERWNHLDILVNCAGFAESAERWKELNQKKEAKLDESRQGDDRQAHWDVTVNIDDELWHRMIRVHLDGTFFCMRGALRLMSSQNRGAIVNFSSTAALTGLPDAPHYSAAKAGVLGLTKAVAQEVGSRGIRVNAICPGFAETPMTEHISTKVKQASLGQIPLGRWAKPEEIAQTALFLASDNSSYLTGQILSPNGGSFTG